MVNSKKKKKKVENKMNLKKKGFIPLGAVFALHWQLNPTQVKCTCNANDSNFIPLGFPIKIRSIRGLYYEYANVFKEIDVVIIEEKNLKCTQRKIYCVTCPNTTKKRLVEYRLKRLGLNCI